MNFLNKLIMKNFKFSCMIIFTLLYIILYHQLKRDQAVKSRSISISNNVRRNFNSFMINPAYERKVLILTNRSTMSTHAEYLTNVFSALRIGYKCETIASIIASSQLKIIGKNRVYYSLVIVESIDLLEFLPANIKQDLLHYSKIYKIGIIFLLTDKKTLQKKQYIIDNATFEIELVENKHLFRDCYLNSNNQDAFFKITKLTVEAQFIATTNGISTNKTWVFKDSLGSSALLKCNKYNMMLKSNNYMRKLFIATNWARVPVLTTLLLDAISYGSFERLNIDLIRYVQIDIDDIFVGASGMRMKPMDVHALIGFQSFLNQNYFDSNQSMFKFNLGYSGYYYQKGNLEENLADQLLIGLYYLLVSDLFID